MTESIVIDRMPISSDKGAYQEQQGGLRLVEIRDQLVYDMKTITGFDHYLRLCMQGVLSCSIHPVEKGLQGIEG